MTVNLCLKADTKHDAACVRTLFSLPYIGKLKKVLLKGAVMEGITDSLYQRHYKTWLLYIFVFFIYIYIIRDTTILVEGGNEDVRFYINVLSFFVAGLRVL